MDYFILPDFDDRIPGKLEGILGSVSQTYNGENLFPTIGESAAAYFVKIATQHPFKDGNKRMSVFLTDAFLTINQCSLSVSWQKMYELSRYVIQKREEKESVEVLQSFVMKVIDSNLIEQEI